MQFVPRVMFLKSVLILLVFLFAFPANSFGQKSDKSLRNNTSRNIENDDIRGEDLSIRRAAVEALGDWAGTVVVMSPQSGRIYTIVNQDWAIRRAFKPCSTIKLVTGVAGYSENLIRSNGALSKGTYRLGLTDSLAYSNNSYFQKVGSHLGSKKMISYARQLGLGEPTGINARGEVAGKLPYGNENLRIYSHADDFEVTPLQLGVMVSAITNGGDLLIPQIPKTKYSKASFRGYYRREISVSSKVFERVIPGMIGAVRYGTAKRINGAHPYIAGKTGSCIANGTWVGLFASVAPIADPRFAVIVITEGKYARGKHSAAVAGKIYRSLRGRFNENYNGILARRPGGLGANSRVATASRKTKRIVTNKTKVEAVGPDRIIYVPRTKGSTTVSTNSSSKKPRVVKTSAKIPPKKTKKLFPTIVINGKSEITRPRIVNNR